MIGLINSHSRDHNGTEGRTRPAGDNWTNILHVWQWGQNGGKIVGSPDTTLVAPSSTTERSR